jgi:DNA-binding CsgD family transcriptional regulator
MAEADREILGRDPELAELRGFVEAVPAGPTALILEGIAGIGKTTLWEAGVIAARDDGCRVLTSRAAQSEAKLSYTALGDLLEGVLDDSLEGLPEPQRRSLEIALLRARPDGAPPDQRAVSLAVVGVLRTIAGAGPVVIAIDDVQWLDTPSARVLSFALRRLEHEAIGVLVSLRVGPGIEADRLGVDRTWPAQQVRRLPLGPLSVEALGRLLRDRTDADLSRPMILRLHGISNGNPLFALEMAGALARTGTRPEPGETLPVPENLQELLRARLAALPGPARGALLAVAAASRPTEELVLASAERPERALAGLLHAQEAGVIEHAGDQIRFSHPLLGSTVYADASPGQKRSLHLRLAELVADPEERARHLALGSTGPDPVVAEALDEAARHARARGAPDAAAGLAELARQLTPSGNGDALRRRSLEAAEYHFDAGDAVRALALLEEAIASSPAGPGRAEILYHLSSMSWMNLEEGVRASLERALPEAGDDLDLLAGIHVNLAWVDMYQGDLAAALEHATTSAEYANRITDPGVRSDAISTLGMVEFLLGRPAQDLMTEAVKLQDIDMTTKGSWTATSVYTTPRSILGLQMMWAGELDAARTLFQHELAEYERLAMYTVRQEVLCYLAELERRAGRWQIAADYAAEAMETVVESGRTATQSHVVLFNLAGAAAHLGEVDIARSQATEGVRLALANNDSFNAGWNRAVLGFLELSLSNHEQAHAHLRPVVEYLDRMGSAEPGIIPCVPDDIEALVSLGRLEEAEALLGRLAEQGRALDRPWALATAARCRGLLEAARGELGNAQAALERAIDEHRRVPQPFELARSLLVAGQIQRRAKQKRPARSSLEQARAIFAELGAPLWRGRTDGELARIGGRPPAPFELTATEEQIARLAAEGRTNREIADALFVSASTVQSALKRVYLKLGVRSRTELARRFGA